MVTVLRKRFTDYMVLRGLAAKTIEGYTHAVGELARYYGRPPDRLSCEEIQAFLRDLITVRGRAWSTVNVYFSAYRCFYGEVLGWEEARFSIPPRGRIQRRPRVLGAEEVAKILRAPHNLKHCALLTMVYGSGLRVSEVCRLKPHHIESNRKMVRVEQSKGRKDRYTILSACALELLGNYWRLYRPGRWLFFGRHRERPMPVGTAQKIYYQARDAAGLPPGGGIHTLRHCFATHLMDAGVDIYAIKQMMGHRSPATTAGYIHVSRQRIEAVRSPLDTLCAR